MTFPRRTFWRCVSGACSYRRVSGKVPVSLVHDEKLTVRAECLCPCRVFTPPARSNNLAPCGRQDTPAASVRTSLKEKQLGAERYPHIDYILLVVPNCHNEEQRPSCSVQIDLPRLIEAVLVSHPHASRSAQWVQRVQWLQRMAPTKALH
jgi:hypothetical protein